MDDNAERGAQGPEKPARSAGWAVGLPLVLGLLGGVLVGIGVARQTHPSDPTGARLRVGFALRMSPPSMRADTGFEEDLAQARSSLTDEKRKIFDLLVAGRGFDAAPSLGRLEVACQKLGWPRCDSEALHSIMSRSEP